jgi:high affinity Mn2+ porin
MVKVRLLTLISGLFMLPVFVAGQVTPPPDENHAAPTAPPVSDDLGSPLDRLWLSGQANFIWQNNPSFPAPYSGPNSFGPKGQTAGSRVFTLYTGYRLTKNLDFLFDLESAGGAGLSAALGLAGFTNLDVVRNPTLGAAPYVARIMLHYTLPLSKELQEATMNPLSLANAMPVRRLEFYLGKMSTVDFFDINSVGSDSHTQFMNWTVDNNGAYDYAADTRGYTYGLVIEYFDKWGAFRFGEQLMPTVANGIDLQWNITKAGAQNFEFELHPKLLKNRETIVRPLAFINTANMGLYTEAISHYLAGQTPTPNIIDTRQQGRVKYGFGLNVEQQLSSTMAAYGRLGWESGNTESFAYTEVNSTAAAGIYSTGKHWGRSEDKVGSAYINNSISNEHARYLQLGGLGFLLGDGNLSYGQERISETYYTLHIVRGITIAGDFQEIWRPGYNQARGPAAVYSFRLHLEDGLQAFRAGHH